MTPEEQIREAEAIARENPEWTWDALLCGLEHNTGAGVELWFFDSDTEGCLWQAASCLGELLTDPFTPEIRTFDSPRAAIRALGFTLREDREAEP